MLVAPGYDIEFNAEAHSYLLNGKPVPSVTKIIEPAYDFRFVKQADLDRASDSGTKVHKTIEMAEEGTLNEKSLHPFLAAHLEQWRRAKKFLGYEPTAFETKVACIKFQYAGTMDSHGLLIPQTDFDDFEELLLDVKTGAKYKAHKLQTAGYKTAAVEMGIVSAKCKRASLYLDETSYEVVWHHEAFDEVAFVSLNNYGYWERHHGQARNS